MSKLGLSRWEYYVYYILFYSAGLKSVHIELQLTYIWNLSISRYKETMLNRQVGTAGVFIRKCVGNKFLRHALQFK